MYGYTEREIKVNDNVKVFAYCPRLETRTAYWSVVTEVTTETFTTKDGKSHKCTRSYQGLDSNGAETKELLN